MKTLTAIQARASLFQLLDQAAQSHKPIQIIGRHNNGILISEEDFESMQETLGLLVLPKMKKYLLKSKQAPLSSYSKKRPW